MFMEIVKELEWKFPVESEEYLKLLETLCGKKERNYAANVK